MAEDSSGRSPGEAVASQPRHRAGLDKAMVALVVGGKGPSKERDENDFQEREDDSDVQGHPPTLPEFVLQLL